MTRTRNRFLWITLHLGFDTVLNFCSFTSAYFFTHSLYSSELDTALPSGAYNTVFALVIIKLLLFLLCDAYRTNIHVAQRYFRLLKVNLLVYFILLFVLYISFRTGDLRPIFTWILVSFILSTLLLVLKLDIVSRLADVLRRRNFSLRKIILVGDNEEQIADFVKRAEVYLPYAMVLGCVGSFCPENALCDRLGSASDLSSILNKYEPTDVVFVKEEYDKEKVISQVNLCRERSVRIYFLPVLHDIFKSKNQIESLGTFPVINIHATPLDDKFNSAVKRVMDVCLSILLIAFCLPLFAVTAVGVYFSSPGPILFRQERVGRGGKTFTMYKFRSMRQNSESDTAWSNEFDDRKTRFGAFLRRTSIDELPQLFNVLLGDMSLVGPRPELPYFVDCFKDRIPLYNVKHYVKPGITGLAQIRGLRGDTSIEDRINSDIEYIENWSAALDIIILFYTPCRAFNRRERYVPKGNGENKENTLEKGFFEPFGKEAEARGKILYAASTMSHINNFHLPYINALRSEGYSVAVMASGDGADYDIPFTKKLFSLSNNRYRAKIRKIIMRERPGAVILNTSLAAFHIRLALKKRHRPRVINIVHGYLFNFPPHTLRDILLLLAEKLVSRRTDCIIVMNRTDEKIAKKYKLTHGKIVFSRGMGASVPPVLNSRCDLRRRLNSTDKFVIAFAGELSKRKNQEFLIYSLVQIKEKIENAVLWLIGAGGEEKRLKALAKDLGLSDYVRFLGQREDVCDLMRACDLYVSASLSEGMPFNVIEAMGCKKTVLLSCIKGHTDLIEDGKTGFLFKSNDVSDFVWRVCEIHSGKFRLSEDDIYKRYLDFSYKRVFSDTLALIKAEVENE